MERHGATLISFSLSLPHLSAPAPPNVFSPRGEMEEEEYREGRGEKTVAYLFAPRLRLRRRLRRPNRNRRVRFHLSGTDCERYREEKVGSDRMFPLLLFSCLGGRSHGGFHSWFTLERSHHSAVQEKTEGGTARSVFPPFPSLLFLICAISRTPFQKWKTEERNEGGKRGGFRLEGLLSGNCPLAQVFGLAGREAGTCSIFPPLGRKGQISQCFSSLPALPSSLVTYVSRRWEGGGGEREREFRAQVTQKIASVRPSSSSSGKRGVYLFRKYLHFYAR